MGRGELFQYKAIVLILCFTGNKHNFGDGGLNFGVVTFLITG